MLVDTPVLLASNLKNHKEPIFVAVQEQCVEWAIFPSLLIHSLHCI